MMEIWLIRAIWPRLSLMGVQGNYKQLTFNWVLLFFLPPQDQLVQFQQHAQKLQVANQKLESVSDTSLKVC